MFFVINKDKVISYIIATLVVVVLFGAASYIQNNNITTIQTMANVRKDIPIYNVETTEKKVSLTINCAW